MKICSWGVTINSNQNCDADREGYLMFTRRIESVMAFLELSDDSYKTLEQAETSLRSEEPGKVPVLYGATHKGEQKLYRIQPGSEMPSIHTVLGVRVVPVKLWELYQLAESVLLDTKSPVEIIAKQEDGVRLLLSRSSAYVDGPVHAGLHRWDLCDYRGMQVIRTRMEGEKGFGSARVFGTLVAAEGDVRLAHGQQQARLHVLTGK